jgi:hypothetical protein
MLSTCRRRAAILSDKNIVTDLSAKHEQQNISDTGGVCTEYACFQGSAGAAAGVSSKER